MVQNRVQNAARKKRELIEMCKHVNLLVVSKVLFSRHLSRNGRTSVLIYLLLSENTMRKNDGNFSFLINENE